MKRLFIFLILLFLGSLITAIAVHAQGPVIFDIETDTGNDTLLAGLPGAILFTVDANGYRIAAMTFAFDINFSNGNIMGPISDTAGSIVTSAAAQAAFESINWNSVYGNGNDPDTMLYGLVDFGRPLWDGSGEVFRIAFTPSGTGSIRFDTVRFPANNLSFVDPAAQSLPFDWRGDGKEITVVRDRAIIDIETNTGNDTLWVGIPGKISFSVDARGNQIVAMTFPFEINFSAGNIIGPLAHGTNVFPTVAAVAVFDGGPFPGIEWNYIYGNGTDPDTMLYGFVGFSGPLWDFAGNVFDINVTPTGEGTIRFDSVLLPPANRLSLVDPAARPVPFDWRGEGKEITAVQRRVIVDVTTDTGNDTLFAGLPGAILFTVDANGYRIAAMTFPFEINFSAGNIIGPLACGTGILESPAAGPPVFENFNWCSETGAAGTDPDTIMIGFIDFGGPLWDFSDEVFRLAFTPSGTGTIRFDSTLIPPWNHLSFVDPTAQLIPFDWRGEGKEITVVRQAPFNVCIDTITAFSNSEVEVCINGLNSAPVPLAGGFDLLLDYDCSMMSLLDITAGDALVAERWEYFTYRIVDANYGHCKVRIVAIADMNNSNVHPSDNNPNGCIAKLRFRTSNDRTLACLKGYIRFEWRDCGDNTISDRSGDTLFIVGGPGGPPWIWDQMGGTDLYHVYPDPWGWNATVTDSNGCPGTQKQAIIPFVTFCNGSVRIICPPEIDDRGDINLNGLAYEIADAVLYSRYFIVGTGVLDPVYYEAQIAASDINADGSPLTVADLVYLIRVITGDAQPIAEGGVGPKVRAAGTVSMVAAQQGSHVTVKSVSDQDLGAALFVFNCEAEVLSVSAVGRASNMDVDYQAEAGELRVLVYNIEDRAKVAAGSGEILKIATSGHGSVELKSVEAATFMGDALKANVSSRVVPTEYALAQNYPNPFNPSTSMALALPQASRYTLTIYNIQGQVVRTFSGHSEAGTVHLTWNGTDNRGAKVASGVYFYRAQAGTFEAVRKMVLVR